MEERKCCNCRYFLCHYVNAWGKFLKADCGHCIKKKISMRQHAKTKRPYLSCDLWEPAEEQVKERKVKIEKRLITMSQEISEIAQILKE